jgi:hypothetical protein
LKRFTPRESGVEHVSADNPENARDYISVCSYEGAFQDTGNAKLIWEGHKADRNIGYCHLEKLHNLEALPNDGFTVACFPCKIRKHERSEGSSPPARFGFEARRDAVALPVDAHVDHWAVQDAKSFGRTMETCC